MTFNKFRIKRIGEGLLALCRIAIGVLVIKTGFDLATGEGPFAYSPMDNLMTGTFAIIIGIYFVFSSVVRFLLKEH